MCNAVRVTIIAAGLFCATESLAAPTPTTAPVTTAPAIADSPRAALKQLAAAIRAGDVQAIRVVLHARNDDEVRLADAMAQYATALSDLQRQAVNVFGEAGAVELSGDVRSGEELARIDAADERVDGDQATITFKPDDLADAAPPVNLRRVDGHWRLPVSEFVPGAQSREIEERLSELAAQTQLVRDISQEVGARQYSTAEKAAQAFRLRIYASGSRSASQATTRPATQPVSATHPATQPAPAPG